MGQKPGFSNHVWCCIRIQWFVAMEEYFPFKMKKLQGVQFNAREGGVRKPLGIIPLFGPIGTNSDDRTFRDFSIDTPNIRFILFLLSLND